MCSRQSLNKTLLCCRHQIYRAGQNRRKKQIHIPIVWHHPADWLQVRAQIYTQMHMLAWLSFMFETGSSTPKCNSQNVKCAFPKGKLCTISSAGQTLSLWLTNPQPTRASKCLHVAERLLVKSYLSLISAKLTAFVHNMLFEDQENSHLTCPDKVVTLMILAPWFSFRIMEFEILLPAGKFRCVRKQSLALLFGGKSFWELSRKRIAQHQKGTDQFLLQKYATQKKNKNRVASIR